MARPILKPCPFCGGRGKISFRQKRFAGYNAEREATINWGIQVICTRCRSRGRPITTKPTPFNAYVTEWWTGRNSDYTRSENSVFEPYVQEAVDAWNERCV